MEPNYLELIEVVQDQTFAIHQLHASVLLLVALICVVFVCILFYKFLKLFY